MNPIQQLVNETTEFVIPAAIDQLAEQYDELLELGDEVGKGWNLNVIIGTFIRLLESTDTEAAVKFVTDPQHANPDCPNSDLELCIGFYRLLNDLKIHSLKIVEREKQLRAGLNSSRN